MNALHIKSGCSGKDGYLTFVDAQHVAERMRRNQDLSVVAYHCKHCGKAHVGDDQAVQRSKRIQWLFKKRDAHYAV